VIVCFDVEAVKLNEMVTASTERNTTVTVACILTKKARRLQVWLGGDRYGLLPRAQGQYLAIRLATAQFAGQRTVQRLYLADGEQLHQAEKGEQSQAACQSYDR
jgi:hypothetical protein